MKNIFEIENCDVNYLVDNLTKTLQQNHLTFFNEIAAPLKSLHRSSLTPVKKYHQILSLLYHKLQTLQNVQGEQELLIKDLVALMSLFSRDWSELRLINNTKPLQIRIDQSLQNFTLQLNFDPNIFDSFEHYVFCHKWKVSGALQDYPLWHKIEALLKVNLDQNNYTRIVAEVLLPFGLNMKSDVINSEDFNYDQYGTITHHDNNAPTMTVDVKTEIDIWKPENIVKLCLKYLQDYARQNNDDINAIEEKATAIRHHVLMPLFKEFINQARKLASLREYSEAELHMQLLDFDDKVNQLKMASAKIFVEEFQNELQAIANQPKMLRSILKKQLPVEEPTTKPNLKTFVEQHPVLINSLKGIGYGVTACTVVLGAGTLIYTTGGAGAVLIGGIIKTLGLAGSVAVSAAATTVPAGLIGAGVGVGKTHETQAEVSPKKKKVHFAGDVREYDGPKDDLSYNRYYQKFMKTMNTSTTNIKPSPNDLPDHSIDISIPITVSTDDPAEEVSLLAKDETKVPFEFPGELRLRM